MQEWKNQKIYDQEFTITSKDVFSFGLELELQRCKVVLKASKKSLIFSGVKVFDSVIQITKKFKNTNWHHAYFERCRFLGDIIGNDFGRPSEPLWWSEAGIKSCDFSESSLHGCRFYNVTLDEIKLPSWPCFTILDPVKNCPGMLKAKWPEGMSGEWVELLLDQPPGLSFIVLNAKDKIENYGGKLESFLQKLKTFPFIHIN